MPKPHWIAKFLTGPWEINGKGDLAFFDFGAGRTGRPTPSARLFREGRRRSAALEERLNRVSESPLAQARGRLLAPEGVAFEDWKTYRAVILTLFLQASRTNAMERRNDTQLAALLSWPDEQIDQMAVLVAQDKRLVRLGTTNPANGLFYPEGGLFGVLTRDPGCLTGWSWGMALPLTPFLALAWVSETADLDWLFDQCTTTAHLQACSLSGPKARRVVLPPVLAEHRDKLAGWLIEYRARMDAWRREVQECRATELKALQEQGARLYIADRATQRYGRLADGESPPEALVEIRRSAMSVYGDAVGIGLGPGPQEAADRALAANAGRQDDDRQAGQRQGDDQKEGEEVDGHGGHVGK